MTPHAGGCFFCSPISSWTLISFLQLPIGWREQQDNEGNHLGIDNLALSTFFVWEDAVWRNWYFSPFYPYIITQKNKEKSQNLSHMSINQHLFSNLSMARLKFMICGCSNTITTAPDNKILQWYRALYNENLVPSYPAFVKNWWHRWISSFFLEYLLNMHVYPQSKDKWINKILI